MAVQLSNKLDFPRTVPKGVRSTLLAGLWGSFYSYLVTFPSRFTPASPTRYTYLRPKALSPPSFCWTLLSFEFIQITEITEQMTYITSYHITFTISDKHAPVQHLLRIIPDLNFRDDYRVIRVMLGLPHSGLYFVRKPCTYASVCMRTRTTDVKYRLSSGCWIFLFKSTFQNILETIQDSQPVVHASSLVLLFRLRLSSILSISVLIISSNIPFFDSCQHHNAS